MGSMKHLVLVLFLCGGPMALHGQEEAAPGGKGFDRAAASIEKRLEKSIGELNALREKAASENVALSRKLSQLESELSKVRLEYQETARLFDSHTLDLSNLQTEIKSRKEEAAYLSNLFGEYIRNFESRLHIAPAYRRSPALPRCSGESQARRREQ